MNAVVAAVAPSEETKVLCAFYSVKNGQVVHRRLFASRELAVQNCNKGSRVRKCKDNENQWHVIFDSEQKKRVDKYKDLSGGGKVPQVAKVHNCCRRNRSSKHLKKFYATAEEAQRVADNFGDEIYQCKANGSSWHVRSIGKRKRKK